MRVERDEDRRPIRRPRARDDLGQHGLVAAVDTVECADSDGRPATSRKLHRHALLASRKEDAPGRRRAPSSRRFPHHAHEPARPMDPYPARASPGSVRRPSSPPARTPCPSASNPRQGTSATALHDGEGGARGHARSPATGHWALPRPKRSDASRRRASHRPPVPSSSPRSLRERARTSRDRSARRSRGPATRSVRSRSLDPPRAASSVTVSPARARA